MSDSKSKGNKVVKSVEKKKKHRGERSRSADHSRSRSRSNSRERSRSRSRSRSRDRNKKKNKKDERDRDRSRSKSRSDEEEQDNLVPNVEARLAAEKKRRGCILPPSVAARIRAGLDLQDLGGLRNDDIDDLYDNDIDGNNNNGNNNNNNNNNNDQELDVDMGPSSKPPKRRIKGRQTEEESKDSGSSEDDIADLSKRDIRRLLR